MALNMDDLIGSMQHSMHAGDRGHELHEIRESLKASLPAQHGAGPSQPAQPAPRRTFAPQPGNSSLDADVAMLSSSSSQQQSGYGGQFFGGGAGSWGSQSSGSSSGVPAQGGWRFAPAPANTPQQTPVETSALARQLQAELERQPQWGQPISPPSQQHGYTTQPNGYVSPDHPPGRTAGVGNENGDAPRSFVNGFDPTARDDSATPTGNLSPRLRNATPR
ncbi:hypothetical protein PSEUBRA_003993 [Kalmanozyma brasiliensis GHG001]|uniref:uncharacterized protein n=1 Tax=Kalmanozyma brasiliensis (strain GHG001) TaxID=1365824 RepID=UPI002867EE90|nr:uncharacterized protein PSEUBRA_003993 [Kalmanozyma brasiliensis GHG001]KAF6767325.1 hypothetical protein PSEUBRA_003993 [Kalmanozyma brasiliensis GHG001]